MHWNSCREWYLFFSKCIELIWCIDAYHKNSYIFSSPRPRDSFGVTMEAFTERLRWTTYYSSLFSLRIELVQHIAYLNTRALLCVRLFVDVDTMFVCLFSFIQQTVDCWVHICLLQTCLKRIHIITYIHVRQQMYWCTWCMNVHWYIHTLVCQYVIWHFNTSNPNVVWRQFCLRWLIGWMYSMHVSEFPYQILFIDDTMFCCVHQIMCASTFDDAIIHMVTI